MIRMILREYWFGMNLEQVKKTFGKRTFVILVVQICTLMAVSCLNGNAFEGGESWQAHLLFGLIIVLLVFGSFLAAMFPNQLSDIMFLLPLEQRDRKKYLVTAYWLRIMVVLFPVAVCSLSLTAMGELHISKALGGIWSTFLFFAECNLDFERIQASDWYLMKERRLSGYGIWSAITVAAIILSYLVNYSGDVWAKSQYFPLDAIIGVGIPSLLAIGICCYWKPVMEIALNFECMQVAKNVANGGKK